jgi:hypothetical protein
MSAPWEAAGGPQTLRGRPLSRLDDQIAWHDRKSQHSQRWFKRLKVSQIVTAAAIPVAAAASSPGGLMGAGGGFIVVLDGLQQLHQYQQNWAAYRSTCERSKHEKFSSRRRPAVGHWHSPRAVARRVH